jgi:hypothetical protein
MMEPIQRVNVDFTAEVLRELDGAAKELNISRQAVINAGAARSGLAVFCQVARAQGVGRPELDADGSLAGLKPSAYIT